MIKISGPLPINGRPGNGSFRAILFPSKTLILIKSSGNKTN
jgi:hypothetical protein